MVEISLSGSGEGPGGAIPRGYSTTVCGKQATSPATAAVDITLNQRSAHFAEKHSRSRYMTPRTLLLEGHGDKPEPRW